MGYFLGKKIPDYDPWWQEREGLEDHEKWYHLGRDEGYAEGYSQYGKDGFEYGKLERENESLKALIAVNKRLDPEFDKYLKEALEQARIPSP